MAELLKNYYSEDLIERIGKDLSKHCKNFEYKSFKSTTYTAHFKKLELKERMRFITESIHQFLPFPYKEQVSIIRKVAPNYGGLQGMIFPDFVQVYGLSNFETSLSALEDLTQYSTAEFAIRPFILKYPKTMEYMLRWSKSENFHVRRLASEGCRPLLPWAPRLSQFIKNPAPVLEILNILKNDSEDYVYRSAANNLNDISKDHPELAIKTAKEWLKSGKNSKWAAKHGMRTLLKKGDQNAMGLFGFGNTKNILVKSFKIENNSIKIGDNSTLSINIINTGKKAKFRLEYAIYYLKKNGSHSEKVFQLFEKEMDTNVLTKQIKKCDFKNLTTRKHYTGSHFISLIVNGERQSKIKFELVEP